MTEDTRHQGAQPGNDNGAGNSKPAPTEAERATQVAGEAKK